jgi:hypothetical protein
MAGLVPLLRLVQYALEDPIGERLDDPRLLGERNELIGWDHAANGMLPAQQRFEAHDQSALEVDQRLVVNAQTAVLDRSPQVRHQCQVACALLFVIGAVDGGGPGCPLGYVQGDVCPSHQDLRRCPVLRIRCDADAGLNGQCMTLDGKRAL